MITIEGAPEANAAPEEERNNMTERLATLMERARAVQMSGAQKEAQRRSFAFGNTKIENEKVTREMVERAVDASDPR